MKIVIKIFLSILLFNILLSSNCNKQELAPSPTQIGANTFNCLLNGTFWAPAGGGPFGNPTSGGFFHDIDGSIDIYIKAYTDQNYFQIYLKNVKTPGTYLLNETTDVRPNTIYPKSYGAYFIVGQTEYYVTDLIHTGVVKIIYADTLQGIVAGTFDMKLFRQSSQEQITISKGKFDYKTH